MTLRRLAEMNAVLDAVQDSLTVMLWGADADTPENCELVRAVERIAGRVLFESLPTGVAMTAAQQHGGPGRRRPNPSPPTRVMQRWTAP